ncbi:polysialyltransferase family glycosyltransferase [Brevifollis gellanilyticus]|uniref:Uncharacterized protein n=1 Tax=Brevifollis gellanilyticus TaxID=748831 RepID=A0A512M9Y7_9BACT|nr:hypothetical protein [Brevifollis gellanilyticus]GEP43545.1 hypothetical protein BGE01nite_28360 [Brevifollis gellanilyticus]
MSQSTSKPCRLLAVNGPVQVLCAVAALQAREAIRPVVLAVPVVLGIQPLHTQDAARAKCLEGIIRECAHVLHAFEAVVDMQQGPDELRRQGWEAVEISVNMLEVPESRALFQQWPQARRILYGDGLGLAQTTGDFGAGHSKKAELRRWLGRFLPVFRRGTDAEGAEPCEEAYVLARHPRYALRCSRQHFIPAAKYRQLFERLAERLTVPALDSAIEKLPAGKDCDILLMTNLPGGPVTDADAEVVAYVHLLTEDARALPPAVWVKPHPRNSTALLSSLREKLSKLYQSVVMFDAPEEAALPFEVVLGRAIAKGSVKPEALCFFAASTAACSVPVVFGKPVKIGFGARACQGIYKQDTWLATRLLHERRLRALVNDLLGLTFRGRDVWTGAWSAA